MGVSFRHSAGFGKRMEYKIIGDMLMEGLDVYVPLVDDHGVDCIIKKEDGSFIEVQIKARSNDVAEKDGALFAAIEHETTPNYFFVFRSERLDTTWIVGSAAITNLAKALITPLKALPIAGQVINGVVAGVIVLALGEAEIATGEAIYTGRIDPTRIEEVSAFIEKKLKDSPLIGEVVSYLQKNAQDLIGKNSKEIFEILQEVLKNGLTKGK